MPDLGTQTPQHASLSPLFERETERPSEPMRFVAHLPNIYTRNEREALCGAEIAGIPAFGQFDKCAICDAEWTRIFG